MSDIDNDLNAPDELTTLKARADMLGIKYHPSISVERLREKVNASAEEPVETPVVVEGEETLEQRRTRKKREANELLRINVTCMNPAKADWDGEIITAGNSLVGSFTKFVPFNTTDGYHVPRIIYNQLVERQCQIFITTRDSKGNQGKQGKLIKEFAIAILPNLTTEELHDLAQRQAMANAID
jgi:hypothetical protein